MLLVLGATAFAVPSAQAVVTDVTVSTPDFTVTFSISDVAFDGPGCVDVPSTNTYVKTGGQPTLTSARLSLSANQEGAANGIGADFVASSGSPVTDNNDHGSIKVCPERVDLDRGPLFVSGTLTSTVIGGARSEAAVPLGQIALVPNPVSVSRPKVKVSGGYSPTVHVTGTATARTLTKGIVPSGGTLTLQVRKPGSKSWISGVSSRTDSYGDYEFHLPTSSKYPSGTRFRVKVSDCGWCANATSAVARRR